jgi:hypothetical protein
MKTTISSKNQSGGITAQNVNTNSHRQSNNAEISSNGQSGGITAQNVQPNESFNSDGQQNLTSSRLFTFNRLLITIGTLIGIPAAAITIYTFFLK